MTGTELLSQILTTGSPTLANAIRPDKFDQKDRRPGIVFRKVHTLRDYGLDNTLLAQKDTFYIECWGATREEAEELAEQVVAILVAANQPPSEDEPDGYDPIEFALCSVVIVELWLDIQLPA